MSIRDTATNLADKLRSMVNLPGREGEMQAPDGSIAGYCPPREKRPRVRRSAAYADRREPTENTAAHTGFTEVRQDSAVMSAQQPEKHQSSLYQRLMGRFVKNETEQPPVKPQASWSYTQQQPVQPRQGYTQEQPMQQPVSGYTQQQNNPVQVMNGCFQNPDGSIARHTERILQVSCVQDAQIVLDSMMQSETVIVNLEAVPDNFELQRCKDLLYGAAVALNAYYCRVANNVYLIAPQYVSIQLTDNLSQINRSEQQQFWPTWGQQSHPQMPYGNGREQRRYQVNSMYY